MRKATVRGTPTCSMPPRRPCVTRSSSADADLTLSFARSEAQHAPPAATSPACFLLCSVSCASGYVVSSNPSLRNSALAAVRKPFSTPAPSCSLHFCRACSSLPRVAAVRHRPFRQVVAAQPSRLAAAATAPPTRTPVRSCPILRRYNIAKHLYVPHAAHRGHGSVAAANESAPRRV